MHTMRQISVSAVLACITAALGLEPPVVERRDMLFTFDGVAGLREKHCVPSDYELPDRVQNITAQCLSQAREHLDSPPDELLARGTPYLFRSPGNSVRKFHLSIRDCMADNMGYIDDSGEFIAEKLEEEIAALQFPEDFTRDVQAASRACLYHMPADLSTEQRQDFYYVCRDSLLEVNCLFKRFEVEDPIRALDIGIQQTQCLDEIRPSANVLAAMDECKKAYDVPVKYASLRKRRTIGDDIDGSGAAEEEEKEQEFVFAKEEEGRLPLAERVNMFVHCVHRSIGAVEGGQFNAEKLIEELKLFQGDENHVRLQVDAATHCQDTTTLEEFNMCYYDDISSACHIFQVRKAFLAGDPSLLPKYD